jgi:hypothetical protein
MVKNEDQLLQGYTLNKFTLYKKRQINLHLQGVSVCFVDGILLEAKSMRTTNARKR